MRAILLDIFLSYGKRNLVLNRTLRAQTLATAFILRTGANNGPHPEARISKATASVVTASCLGDQDESSPLALAFVIGLARLVVN